MHVLHRPREEHALAQLRPELRRDGQPVLGVEVVFEGAGEGQGACRIAKREGRSVDPGWRSGRSPATRERLRTGKVPHFAPLCNTEPALRPTLASSSFADRKVAVFAGISSWDGIRADRRRPARAAAVAASARAIAFARPLRGPGGAEWEEFRRSSVVPSSAGMQRRGHEQQHGGDEQQRDDELDLRRGLGRLLGRGGRRARERASAAWAASVVASGAPWRSARRSAATSAGCPWRGSGPRGGRACRSAGSPMSARAAARLSSPGEQAGVAAADLGERAPRREPGRDRDPQQVEHVGQLGLDRACARAGAPAQRVLGREVAGDGRGEQQREAEPAGRRRSRAAATTSVGEQREARPAARRSPPPGGPAPRRRRAPRGPPRRLDAERRAEPGDERRQRRAAGAPARPREPASSAQARPRRRAPRAMREARRVT